MFTMWQSTTFPRQVDKCPVEDTVCHHCPRKGHFSAQCRTKSVSSISEDTACPDTLIDQSEVSWQTQVELNGKVKHFKMDMGAEITAISPDTYKCLPTNQKFFLVPLGKH